MDMDMECAAMNFGYFYGGFGGVFLFWTIFIWVNILWLKEKLRAFTAINVSFVLFLGVYLFLKEDFLNSNCEDRLKRLYDSYHIVDKKLLEKKDEH